MEVGGGGDGGRRRRNKEEEMEVGGGGAAEAKYGNAKTSVWWDMNKCRVPDDGSCDPNTIAHNITSALIEMEYSGTVDIFAYYDGESERIPKSVQQALSSTGVTVNQVPSSPSGASITKILADMLFWAVDNPAPANYLLISGDCNFSYTLHQLRMRKYNILLVQPHIASASLVAAAKSVWHWNSILTGRLFSTTCENQKFFSIAPHEFLNPKKLDTSSTSIIQPNFAPDIIFREHQFIETNFTIQPNFAPDNFFRRDSPIPNGPPVTEQNFSPSSVPKHGKPRDFDGSQKNRYQNGRSEAPNELSLASTTDGVWGSTECPEPPEYVQGLIGIVLLTLHTLKCERMIPTEENITDCIRCGDPRHRNTDVRSALDHAIEQHMIVKQNLGALKIYVGKNAQIWKCINPIGGNPKDYSRAVWEDIQTFLSSRDGEFKMMASGSRYEAATFLKNSCLKYLPLGDVLKILNMVIAIKKWIVVDHQSGWQPISIK